MNKPDLTQAQRDQIAKIVDHTIKRMSGPDGLEMFRLWCSGGCTEQPLLAIQAYKIFDQIKVFWSGRGSSYAQQLYEERRKQ